MQIVLRKKHLPLPIHPEFKVQLMHYQKGLSLVELMISITLGLLLTVGVTQIFLSSKDTYRNQQASSRVQESGRLALEFINKDLRMAGFTGFRGRGVKTLNQIAVVNYATQFEDGLSVYPADSIAELNALAGTNIIVIRGVLAGESSALVAPAEVGALTVTLRSSEVGGCSDGTTRFNGICINDNMIVADAYKSVAFRANKLELVDDGANLKIQYAGAWGGNYIDTSTYFDVGAQVSVAKTRTYFIRNGASGEPSLFLRENESDVQEMLEGVENIAIRFNRSDSLADYEDAADEVDGLWGDENPMVSVQLEVLIKSMEDNILDEKQKFTFNEDDIEADDFRFYQTFSATVAFRNQLQ